MEGRVLDYENSEFIGLTIKVEWRTGQVRWYPAVNLKIGGSHFIAFGKYIYRVPLFFPFFSAHVMIQFFVSPP